MSRLRQIPARRPRGEGGFTLPELLVTVAILGIIAPALAGVLISYLKTTASTQSRITESHDVQFTTAYWQRDVASIGVRAFDPSTKTFPLQQSVGVTPACSLPTHDTRVITLAWSEYDQGDLDATSTPTTVTVSYLDTVADGVHTLTRVRCDGGTVTSTVDVADSLLAVPTATCDGGACGGAGAPDEVTLSLEARDVSGGSTTSYTAELRGERRQS